MKSDRSAIHSLDDALIVLVELIKFTQELYDVAGKEDRMEYETILNNLRRAHVSLVLKWAEEHGLKESTLDGVVDGNAEN
jgi:hypothetical protein